MILNFFVVFFIYNKNCTDLVGNSLVQGVVNVATLTTQRVN
jgi:hypothetical protein